MEGWHFCAARHVLTAGQRQLKERAVAVDEACDDQTGGAIGCCQAGGSEGWLS